MGNKEKEKVRFCSNPGSRYAEVHAIRIDDFGHKTLVKTGEKKDTYAIILSHKDECDIENLLARCEVEGYELLNKREASYGDVTLAPESLMDAQRKLQDMENEFNHLPIDVRREFNFSFSEYIAEAGNDIKSWASKMGYLKEESATPETPETPAETANPIKEGGE